MERERRAFEELVAATAGLPRAAADLRRQLGRQLAFQIGAEESGLDELAALLAAWFEGARDLDTVARLAEAFPRQPLVQLYVFALRREAGDPAAASSLAALRALDPGDPLAAQLAAAQVAAASEEERLANIARLATTALLRNPYQLATGAIFELIRGREAARVLDVGVGSGAQLAELLALLRAHEHRLRRLELVGLDFIDQFLETAGARIAAAKAPAGVEVVYLPVRGRVEELDEAQARALRGEAGLDAANATIALHEVPGERKLAALRNLRRLAPAHLLLAEWNYHLENTLPTESAAFVFGVRSVAADWVAALRGRYSHDEARAVVRDWLSQAGGQIRCPADERQECFLPVASWRALLERSGFGVATAEERWLAYAELGDVASLEDGGMWIATSRREGHAPVALLHAVPV
jgi:SAM-dependent methyltransferase